MHRLSLRLATAEDAAKVQAFNTRMMEGGWMQRLDLGASVGILDSSHSSVVLERYLCVDGKDVRGGLKLKRMEFRVKGKSEEVGFSVYPVSEGIINPRFAPVALMMHKQLLLRYPLMYGLGAGSLEEKIAKLLRFTGCYVLPTPFHFRVFRAFSFLRKIVFLRNQRWRAAALDCAAYSGIGTIGLAAWNLFQRLRGRYPKTSNLKAERFDKWGNFADELWQNARDYYSLIGDRSSAALRVLYPEGHEQLIKLRFRVNHLNTIIGWAVITVANVQDHRQFGNMRLGAIVDMFGAPEHADSIISGAMTAVRRAGADLVVVNHSDQRWNAAIRRAGMVPGPTNRFLFLSPELKKRLDPIQKHAAQSFFTRGDGHGPRKLW